jgi:transcription-repair coupling factor (superfamily II helicase)
MQTLDHITAEIGASPAVATLLQMLAERAQTVHVGPLIGAARPPMVASIAQQHRAPILYVLPNNDAALRAADDLRLWLGADAVWFYPASDALPYEHMSPGPLVLRQRLQVLQALQAGSAVPGVIVATVKALLQPTLTPDELQRATLTIRLGMQMSHDQLLRHLIEVGYRPAPSVSEPGTFNRRGGIMDLWPMAVEQPYRMEFFGDEIDSLRAFDPLTQRSEQRLHQITVGPPHEIPLWRRAAALEQLASLDLSTLRAEAREEWDAAVAQLAQGERFEGRAFFAPFFRETANEQATLQAHLPPGSVLMLAEGQFIAQHAREIHAQAETQRQRLIELGELPPDFPRPYGLWETADGRQPTTDSGQPTADGGQPTADGGQPTTDSGQPTTDSGQPTADGGQPTADGGQPTADGSQQSTVSNRRSAVSGQRSAVGAAQISVVDLSQNDQPLEAVDALVAPPSFVVMELFGGQFRRLVQDIVTRLGRGERVIAVTSQAARLAELVREAGKQGTLEPWNLGTSEPRGTESGEQRAESVRAGEPGNLGTSEPQNLGTSEPQNFTVLHGALEGGWQLATAELTLYTDTEIFGLRQQRALREGRKQRRSDDERAAFLRGLKPGDYVVHIEHGIAVFEQLIRRTVGEIEREYLVLRYAADDKIYVPVDQVDRVTRYIGAGDGAPVLTRLGTQDWERAKRKARAAVQDLADELLKLYAQRQMKQGYAFSADNEWQRELESSFPYMETNDQLHAITDVKADMERTVPMDRLICGDVGFGKTEVALRAAFKAVQDGRQVAVLVPTTVLAQQHFDTFRRRMAAFPVTVEMISRFRSPKEQEAIVGQLRKGQVDILIGTHRILSKDVQFKELGLVIVDEEQRFGVRHKERLKHLRAEVDVLTLTATPIPRTLHMAMAGIRDLSVIDTPPEDRVPIKTYVQPTNDNLIREAILREIERDGQIYFVHNRVHSIYHVANHLKSLVPEARIGVGHGQLDERELERVMLDFFEGRYDVLVCTTIIESGLDIPNANTIIIDDATNFGLAQLYQLRGRVGRSMNRAYAYLLYKQEKRMTEEAQARLEAIQEATELGAGFRVAMRDLEIRGAGNLLGAEQSGHIAAVGFDLYSKLLEQAVKQLKTAVDKMTTPAEANPVPRSAIINEKVLVAPLVTLDLPLTAYLPEEYIPDATVRIGMYQRMVAAEQLAEVRGLRQELQDRFGDPPTPALHLLTWLQIKALALQAGVSAVTTASDEFIIRLPILEPPARERLRRRFGRDASVKVGPQFVRLDRRALGEGWSEKLIGVLAALGGEG